MQANRIKQVLQALKTRHGKGRAGLGRVQDRKKPADKSVGFLIWQSAATIVRA
jgi:hypothetical protein